MDPWETIRRASRDTRSGAAEIALAAARGIASLQTRRDVLKAARMLLRAHPAMAPLWTVLSGALSDGPAAAKEFARRAPGEAAGAAHAASWILTRKTVVLTHSSSSSVLAALRLARRRVSAVICTESNPGGEGKSFARRLARDGFAVEVVPDAGMIAAAERAGLVLTGADAVTEHGVVNKIGTRLIGLAARETGTPFYAIAGSSKILPDEVWLRASAPAFERTPLRLLDGVVTERGVLSAAAVRRAARRVHIPRELARLVG